MVSKLVLNLSGLHCRACELLTEDKIKEISGVKKVRVNHQNGRAEIFYEGSAPDLKKIKTDLEAIGYGLVEREGTKPEEATSKKTGKLSDYWLSVILGLILLYWLLSRLPILDLSSLIKGAFSLPLALLVGLVAGVSTCLALVGGLVLGAAATYAQNHPDATRAEKFRPHLIFNAGRVIGFFILGGILGLLGSTFKLSPLLSGLLTFLVGLVILILGLKLLEIFPVLNKFEFSLPKSFGRTVKTGAKSNGASPFILGALTFFLPCGFTQAMQIYALGSGDFFTGGLIMAFFALGTVPGLLSLGGLSAVFSQKKSTTFFKIAGAVVVLFALVNLNNGWKLIVLAGTSGSQINNQNNSQDLNSGSGVTDNSDVQIVRMAETGRGYEPNQFTITKGKPVRWIIDAQAPYSCASSVIIPALNIQKRLKPGENIIEFTPTQTGSLPFSCSMGMYTGNFTVVEK